MLKPKCKQPKDVLQLALLAQGNGSKERLDGWNDVGLDQSTPKVEERDRFTTGSSSVSVASTPSD